MKEERIRFCGLKEREVINICDCKRLGFVADLQINICSGCVEALIVPGPGRICGFLGYDAEYIIPFECIRRIGEDIILVEIKEDKCLKPVSYTHLDVYKRQVPEDHRYLDGSHNRR